MALNSQGSVPNSNTDVRYLAEHKSVTFCWDRGPSEARRKGMGMGGQRHRGQLLISGPQEHHPGRSLSVLACHACPLSVRFSDSAAQQGHCLQALPSGLLLWCLFFHREMQTLDQVSGNSRGARRVCWSYTQPALSQTRLKPDWFHLVRLPLKPGFRMGKFCQFGMGKISQSNSPSASCAIGTPYCFSDSVGPNLWLTIAASFVLLLTLVTWKWFPMFIILHSPLPCFPASLHHGFVGPETCVCSVCANRSILCI